jgi:hypothetical protein
VEYSISKLNSASLSVETFKKVSFFLVVDLTRRRCSVATTGSVIMSTPAEKAARLSARLRSPGPEPVGEFLGVEGGVVVDSPLRTLVAFDSSLVTRDSEVESEVSGNVKRPVGLFEFKGDLDCCLGCIGASNRVCIKQRDDCGFGTHKIKNVDLEIGSLYIKCPTKPDCVYLTPTVNLLDNNIPECVGEFLLQENRSVEEHVQLFSSLPTEDEVLGGKIAERFKDIVQHNGSGVQFGRTPAKLSMTRLWDVEEPASSPSGVAGAQGLDNKISTILSRMKGIEEEEYDSSPYKESVSASVTDLASLIQVQSEAIRGIESGTNEMASRIEAGVVGLKSDIGVRPSNSDDLPGLQIWEIVNGLNRRMDDMSGKLAVTDELLKQEQERNRVGAITLAKLSNELGQATAAANLARGLATGHSSKLSEMNLKIRELETKLVATESDAADARALSLLVQDEIFQAGESVVVGMVDRIVALERRRGGGVNSKTSVPENPTGARANADVTALQERMLNLEDTTSIIKSGLGGDSISVGGETFHTAEGLTGWVVENVSSQNNCPTKMIIDVVSLLEQLQDVSKSSDAKLNAKAQARKGGFLSLALARTITSYSVLIPASFAGGSEEDSFSKIKTYKKWSDPRTGFVKSVSDKITLWHQSYIAELKLNYPVSRNPVLNAVLTNLATQATNFFTQLSNFVTNFYLKLTAEIRSRPLPGNKSEQKEYETTLLDTESEAWNLLLAFIGDVFHELSMRRADGVAAENMEDGSPAQFATALYASSRAVKYCKELMDKEFEKHPTMAPTFNGFLFAERASKSDFRRAERRIGDIITELAGLQSKVDKCKKS